MGRKLRMIGFSSLVVGVGVTYYTLSSFGAHGVDIFGIHSSKVNGTGVAERVSVPSRSQTITNMKKTKFDLLVIGGGSTGAGVALDAITRGLKVALVEKDDFGSGTSGRSTKLLHGGVRYLQKAVQKWDRSQFHLVHEALHERAICFKQAPHLTKPLPILTPIYEWWEVPYTMIGLKLYDWLAGFSHIHNSYYISANQTTKEFPMIKKEGLKGSVVYYDGQFDDSRFNVAVALTAALKGAMVGNHLEVVALKKSTENKLNGATVKDLITGEVFDIECKMIVNATGHYADNIRLMDKPDAKKVLVASAGTHIVMDKKYAPPNTGLLITKTEDKRVVFLLPWLNGTLAGTTDSPCEITDNPEPGEKEIDYIIRHLNQYFDVPLQKSDVKSAWSGIRPLKKADDSTDTATISREHGIYTSESGLITIVGGKWTTYRSLSEDVTNHVIRDGGFAVSPCITKDIQLIGGVQYRPDFWETLSAKYSLDKDIATHINLSYGDQGEHVCKLILQNPSLKERIVEGFPYIKAEIVYCIQNEYAQTVLDVISRRLRLTFLDREKAHQAIPIVSGVMATELLWNQKRKDLEETITNQFLFYK